MGDNFDEKYCNSSEKVGNATKERYEAIVRQENYKEVFRDFFYYFNENDPNDKHNSRDRKKFYNPHLNINENLTQIRANNSIGSNSSINFANTTNSINSFNNNINAGNYANNKMINSYNNISGSVNNFNFTPNIQRSINEKINILNNIENKFSKIKILSSSSAASRSAIKHYRHASTSNLSVNSASTSNSSNLNYNNINNNLSGAVNANYIHKRSGSSANFQY